MSFLQKVWTKIKPIITNKYLLFCSVFVLYLIFFDQYNLIGRIKTQYSIKHLEKEVAVYKDKIKADKEKLKELQSDDENLEKFAREQHLMKKENEDIFIIEE